MGDKELTFSYTCDSGAKDTLKVKADGTAVPGTAGATVGTKCTIEDTVGLYDGKSEACLRR